MSRAAKVGRGLGALVLLAGLAAGLPWALWHFVGWPLPHVLPSWSALESALTSHGIPDMDLLKALACVVWVAWALLAASLGAELPATLRGRTPRHGVSPFQPLVSYLLTAVVVASLALSPRATGLSTRLVGAGTGLLAPRPPVAVALVRVGSPFLAKPAADRPTIVGTVEKVPLRTYVVVRHDTLWGIAERELGDPLRWSEIYQLNHGRAEPGGATLDDPNWIYPGWTLLLPSLPATAHPHHVPSPGTTAAPVAPVTTATSTTATTATVPPATRAPTTAVTPPATAVTTSPTTTATTVPAPVPQPAQPPVSVPLYHGHRPHVLAPAVVGLPSGSEVAGSFASGVLAAVAIGRLRRRHAYRYGPPEPGRDLSLPPVGPAIGHLAGPSSDGGDDDGAGWDVPITPLDDVDRRRRPGYLEVGARQGTTVAVEVTDLSGLAVCGPAAEDVVRAIAAALLVRAGPGGAEVLLTADVAERLFAGLGPDHAVRRAPSADELARAVQAATIARARRFDAAEVTDAASFREANPEDPLPVVLAVLEAVTGAATGLWRALSASAARFGIAVLMLGDSPAAVGRLVTDEGRNVTKLDVEPPGEQLAGARLFGLNRDEAVELLGPVIDIRRDQSTDSDGPSGAHQLGGRGRDPGSPRSGSHHWPTVARDDHGRRYQGPSTGGQGPRALPRRRLGRTGEHGFAGPGQGVAGLVPGAARGGY